MYLFIVNLAAGNGQGREAWSFVQKELAYQRISYQVEFTKGSGHATEIARTAAMHPSIQAVIALGGDGTLHEVGNGLMGTNIPLGFIPAGTGNDFAIAHNIPLDPLLALERVYKREMYSIDTADIGNRFMIGFMGMGFDAKVAQNVNDSSAIKKRWFGRLTYGFEAIKTLKTFEPTHVSLVVDGQKYEYDGVWLIALSNIPNYAGGMKICPQACMNDGQLDICCVRDITPAQLLRMLPSVYKGKHTNHPSVIFHRGSEITIDSTSHLPIHADGEIVGKTPVSIKIKPQSLLML